MTEPRRIARYGWRPQIPDHRDLTFGLEEQVFEDRHLPAKFSLREQFTTDVFDQLQIGTCVPNHAVENVLFRAGKLGRSYPMLSRLFVYFEGRKADGLPPDQDTGMEVRTAFKILGGEGAPPETDWPYSDAQPGPFSQPPPAQAYTDAVNFEALEYKQIVVGTPGAPMRSAIFQGMPISFGFPVPQQIEDRNWNPAKTILQLPKVGEASPGGHCEDVIGWDFTMERFPVPAFEIRNSWSPLWGDAGHHYMDFRYFDPPRRLASDLWVISKVK